MSFVLSSQYFQSYLCNSSGDIFFQSKVFNMRFILVCVASLVALANCRNVPIEPQPSTEGANESFLEAVENLESALRAIIQHSSSEVSVEEVDRETGEARDIYLRHFRPAVSQLKSLLLPEGHDDVTADEYRAQIMHELHRALKRTSLTKDHVLSLVLGEDLLQGDGTRLEISLRLLEVLVDRLAGISSDLEGVSLAGVREVSGVADAAMEALQGVANAAADAEEDVEKVLKTVKLLTPPVIEDSTENSDDVTTEEDDVTDDDLNDATVEEGDTETDEDDVTGAISDEDAESGEQHDRGSRNRRQVRFGPYVPPRPSYPVAPPRVNLNLPRPSAPRIPTSVNLGRGWSAGINGVSYNRGNVHFNVKPEFNSYIPPRIGGATATLRIKW